jgi:hypothetical protein
MFKIIATIILSLSCFAGTAHAYLDPGTGSYMLQIFIAGVLAFFFFAKSFFYKVKTFFQKIIGRKDDTK